MKKEKATLRFEQFDRIFKQNANSMDEEGGINKSSVWYDFFRVTPSATKNKLILDKEAL